jgi:NitT/TauT family transport system permease protein
MASLPSFTRPAIRSPAPFTWYDLPVGAAVFALLFALVQVGGRMTAPVDSEPMVIHLGWTWVPYYVLRSLVRMFISYSWSLAFTFVFGPWAARSRRAERIIIPTVDILQSVPVLGFLAITVNGFMALFPGSMLGMEMAAIFAIFTSQAWNIMYAFYQSSRAIPRDLSESAAVFGLSPFQRFARLELPSATTGLVWNTMVSFGGGWFYLAASEAITVLGKDIRLPGIGSYLATAVAAGDLTACFVAIGAMVIVVVTLDFFFFRPLLAWAQKFSTGAALDEDYDSTVLTALQRSSLAERFQVRVLAPVFDVLVNRLPALVASRSRGVRDRVPARTRQWVLWGAGGLLMLWVLVAAGRALVDVLAEASLDDVRTIVLAGLATMGRVAATVILGSLLWVPVGTYIGARPELARRVRPLIQLGAAFPANLVFPLMVIVFARAGVNFSLGSIFLMLLANQWYILFNVIVGALSIPEDLRQVARMTRMTRLQRFRHLTMPVVFPYWVTGALTAAGGSWNASILAEVATFGDTRLECFGLGAYITKATTEGDWPGIVLSISFMCLLVIVTNRLVWRRLYVYAEEHLRLED